VIGFVLAGVIGAVVMLVVLKGPAMLRALKAVKSGVKQTADKAADEMRKS
jgi:hypothetical protein